MSTPSSLQKKAEPKQNKTDQAAEISPKDIFFSTEERPGTLIIVE